MSSPVSAKCPSCHDSIDDIYSHRENVVIYTEMGTGFNIK